MCTGAEMLMMGGQVAGGLAQQAHGSAQRSLAEADALYEKDVAQQQAEKIMRAARREKGAARAATAASGARIDEFALAPETEIDILSREDAAMAILSGDRRARTLRYSGDMAKAAGNAAMSESLFRAGVTGFKGWKGGKKTTQPFYDGTTGDFAFQE